MIKKILLVFVTVLLLISCNGSKEQKAALMWFDATANISNLSTPEQVDYYLNKIKDLGFTHAIVDMRPISGHVLFDTELAPRLREWKGVKVADFDLLRRFIDTGHSLGLEVHASMNTFVAGHNYFDCGAVYEDHPEWASIVYTPEGMKSITEQKSKYSAMVNPIISEYQDYIIALFKDLVRSYPDLDGIILDRVRFDGIEADFSDLSRSEFEKYIGTEVERFPEDIFEWGKDSDGANTIIRGKHFLKWIEFRAKSIYDFMARTRSELKEINPKLSFGTYTGAWYPSYYEVGVNFASSSYDPSQDYDWATEEYKNYGYAELIDLYTTGNYYTCVTIDDYIQNPELVWNETDSQAQSGIWYCVEGSCQQLRNIMGDNKFMGGILVNQFYDNPEDLSRTIEQNLKDSDGLMVFDICHIIAQDLWAEVQEGMRRGGAIK